MILIYWKEHSRNINVVPNYIILKNAETAIIWMFLKTCIERQIVLVTDVTAGSFLKSILFMQHQPSFQKQEPQKFSHTWKISFIYKFFCVLNYPRGENSFETRNRRAFIFRFKEKSLIIMFYVWIDWEGLNSWKANARKCNSNHEKPLDYNLIQNK